MNDAAIADKLSVYRRQIADLREKMRALQASVEPAEVQDYAFATSEGSVQLLSLFGERRDLIVIHNMGSSCAYCTLWADGFNGIYDHIATRAALVVSSPERPDVQQKFAASRNWCVPTVSHAETTFTATAQSMAVGFQGSRHSARMAPASCGYPIDRAHPVMISALSGIFSICFQRAPRLGAALSILV